MLTATAITNVRVFDGERLGEAAMDLPVLTAHVVVDDSCFRDGHLPRLLDQLQQRMFVHFDVEHSTV